MFTSWRFAYKIYRFVGTAGLFVHRHLPVWTEWTARIFGHVARQSASDSRLPRIRSGDFIQDVSILVADDRIKKLIHEGIERSELVRLRDVGDTPVMEEPNEFNRVVEDTLQL